MCQRPILAVEPQRHPGQAEPSGGQLSVPEVVCQPGHLPKHGAVQRMQRRQRDGRWEQPPQHSFLDVTADVGEPQHLIGSFLGGASRHCFCITGASTISDLEEGPKSDGMKRQVFPVLCLLSWWFLELCDAACTLDSLNAFQGDIDVEKLDGHWYVTHQYGYKTTDVSSYTVDVVPTLQDPANTQTVVVVASDGVSFALIYFCDGDAEVAGNCDRPKAWVLGRQPNSSAALAWLTSISASLPCFKNAPEEVARGTTDTDCPFKPIWGLPGRDCNVDTFPVQQNFHLDRYLGMWWEMSWLAPVYIPSDALYNDYRHNYVMKADGNITAQVAGRSPVNGTCFFYRMDIQMTDTPGKMFIYEVTESGEFLGTTDYIVASVDYDHYAIVYGCREQNETTGECTSARAWLWSRDISLARQYRVAANSMFQRLCFNPADFLATEQTNSV
ncbi:hypothetical protein BaRGS_00037144 [Batillaria attramentaria]|uniref:Lipocalin/cytosolic fatty-acid binding domain-containing protein n=1 Tax=Batillaria attramentaria TaxID=370345 RepID=A0ABD0JAS7_9CAEN